jgi:arginase
METRKTSDTRARFKEEILEVCTQLADITRRSFEAGEWPLVIGGDHSIAMGTVSGISAHLKSENQKLGLIWFDAHGDMNLPGTSPTGNIHGMPLSHLLGYGDAELSSILGVNPAIAPENVVLVGIRDIDDVEREFIRESGVTALTMRDIDQLGMIEIARKALEVVNNGTAGFHVSFDLDGCDPEVIPGTGTLVPGGVSFREAHLLLEECAMDGRMTSMEVVELNPFLDLKNISAERAVTLIQSALGRSIL